MVVPLVSIVLGLPDSIVGFRAAGASPPTGCHVSPRPSLPCPGGCTPGDRQAVTRAGSNLFRSDRLCTLATLLGRITVSDRRLIITSHGQREERELTDDNDVERILRERFGVVLR